MLNLFKRPIRRLACLIVFLLISTSFHAFAQDSAEVDRPRLAILLNAKKRHFDEFDGALKNLGWSAEKILSTPEEMAKFPDRLGEFDLVIVSPLFTFEGGKIAMSDEDRGKYKKFLEEGGMIAVTDGSYDGVRAWLTEIDPSFGGLEKGKCNSSQWAVLGSTTNAEPPHPLRFFPSRITEGNSWPHFHKPAEKSKWVLVANCSEGFPVSFAQKVGKGLVSISALRQPTEKHLGNFYSCLKLSRAGIDLKSFDLSEPAVGEGLLRLELSRKADAKSGSFIYEIVSKDGKSERFEKQIEGDVLELPYRFSKRGLLSTRLLLKNGGVETLLFSQEIELPELLTVKPNAYRGILSTARRFPTVTFEVKLAPDQEKLAGTTVNLVVLNSKGQKVGEASKTLEGNNELSYLQAIALDRSLPEGDYKVRGILSQGGQQLTQAETDIKILAPHAAQTIPDEDNTLLVNGKPFFPIGLYHVKPVDYEEVAKLGINTVQFWTWDGPAGLEKAAENGLKAIFELNHRSEKIVRDVVEKYSTNPTILMWYGSDEPAEGSYGTVEMIRNTYNQADDQHPVYMVSCRPDIFAEQAEFADVFAVDPYTSPQILQDWMSKAIKAVDNRKPVICVPGSFGRETAAELRANAYLAVANDARGIMWYPWSQTGGGPVGIGLKSNTEHQAVIKQLCTELQALYPALTAPVRTSFQSEDQKIQGIYCINGSERYIVLVNGTPDRVESKVTIPAQEAVSGKLNSFFETKDDSLSVANSQFKIALDPYETRVFWSK